MTAKQEYAQLITKLRSNPGRPMDALSPTERDRYHQLRDKFDPPVLASPTVHRVFAGR